MQEMKVLTMVPPTEEQSLTLTLDKNSVLHWRASPNLEKDTLRIVGMLEAVKDVILLRSFYDPTVGKG